MRGEGVQTDRGARILVVEDDECTREFLTEALGDEGYDVVTAPHGAAALALVEREPFALVILDMRMPIVDGITFLSRYRELPIPHAPVIGMAAWHPAAEAARRAGAAATLAKPFDLDEMLELVAQTLSATAAD